MEKGYEHEMRQGDSEGWYCSDSQKIDLSLHTSSSVSGIRGSLEVHNISRELAPLTAMHWAQSSSWLDCDTHIETFLGQDQGQW